MPYQRGTESIYFFQVVRMLLAANADVHIKTLPAMSGPAQRSALHEACRARPHTNSCTR